MDKQEQKTESQNPLHSETQNLTKEPKKLKTESQNLTPKIHYGVSVKNYSDAVWTQSKFRGKVL